MALVQNLIQKSIVGLISPLRHLPLQIDITNACNLNCSHCYHSNHLNSGALTLTEWISVIDQYENLINKLYLKPRIIICGGEPLTSPHLISILSEINKRWPGLGVRILTNGTMFNYKKLLELSKFNVSFQISIDGSNANSHDSVRGKGNFAKTIEGIKKADSFGFKIDILAILSKRTSTEISSFYELAQKLPIQQLNFVRLIEIGSAQSIVELQKDRPLQPLELRDAYLDIIKCSKLYKIQTNTYLPLFNLLDSSLGATDKLGFSLVIDYKGNLKASSRASNTTGNVREEKLEDLFLKNELFKKLRSGIVNKCQDCKHVKRCGGNRSASFAAFKSFFEKDPGCWI